VADTLLGEGGVERSVTYVFTFLSEEKETKQNKTKRGPKNENKFSEKH